jgi:hypothetical protein
VIAQLDRSAVRQAAEEDTLYRGVSAPNRVQVSEEPVVTEVPKVGILIIRAVTGTLPPAGPPGQCHGSLAHTFKAQGGRSAGFRLKDDLLIMMLYNA